MRHTGHFELYRHRDRLQGRSAAVPVSGRPGSFRLVSSRPASGGWERGDNGFLRDHQERRFRCEDAGRLPRYRARGLAPHGSAPGRSVWRVMVVGALAAWLGIRGAAGHRRLSPMALWWLAVMAMRAGSPVPGFGTAVPLVRAVKRGGWAAGQVGHEWEDTR